MIEVTSVEHGGKYYINSNMISSFYARETEEGRKYTVINLTEDTVGWKRFHVIETPDDILSMLALESLT